jgi:IS5 family transposase
VRVDTTVVPSNVSYPTDSGLLAKAVNRIAVAGRRIRAAGGAVRTKLRDRSRAAGRRAHELNAKLRTRSAAANEEALAVVRRKNAELADLAETAANEAERLLRNAKRALRKARADASKPKADGRHDSAAGRRCGRLARAVNDLAELVEATRRIVGQTRQRLAGTTPDGATRRVSLHDPDARPIRKGRLGKPVEFGHKAQVCDNEDGIVLDHDVQPGNPPDAPRLKPAVERVIKRTSQKPRTVTADRGYGEAAVEDELHELGIRDVVIPRRGRPSKARQDTERGRSFRRTVKWRTGCEGRISHLKRNYGWDRSMIDGTEGARIWTGHGVMAHNLAKIAALTA